MEYFAFIIYSQLRYKVAISGCFKAWNGLLFEKIVKRLDVFEHMSRTFCILQRISRYRCLDRRLHIYELAFHYAWFDCQNFANFEFSSMKAIAERNSGYDSPCYAL